MLPYPSGTLHIGHIRNYSIGDALARYKWMRGYNVLHPMGWDAFGLPAENAAIEKGVPPGQWTRMNIEAMKKTHRRFGFSYDWDREVSTCEPEYYRWNQWFFLKMLERGLAYRKEALVNWCPRCATVLANEQVVDGCCWRHESTPVEQRALEQWFLRITRYADELLAGLAELEEGWPERVLTMQRNWISRSEGTEVEFRLEATGAPIRVFTTRVDTIFGATCVILAPEHPLVSELVDEAGQLQAKAMVDARSNRDLGDIDKEGFFTGHYAVNPYNRQKTPI
jgi:leucyl-tRNA synthetase